MLTRVTQPVHWHRRYHDVIDAIRATPFTYGSHDCAVGLVGAVVEALTGVDVVAPFRSTYINEAEAQALVQASGHASLADFVAALLPEIPEGQAGARIGDVAAIPDAGPFGFSLGIFNGERVFVLTPTGLGTVDRLRAARAFWVG